MIPLTLGGLFLIGLVADVIGTHSPLPRVTLLLLAGVLVGPAGIDLLPSEFVNDWFETLTYVALSMIGFLLGGDLTQRTLAKHGRQIIVLSVCKALGAALIVGAALPLFGVPWVVALLLAGIATATAPAATYDVVRELKARGPFARTLLRVVALDDAWGLILFTFLLAAAHSVNGDGGHILVAGLRELGSSVLLGVAFAIPMVFLTGRLRSGEPTQAEALGFVLAIGGSAVLLQVSPILSAMVMGSLVASFAKHHKRPFDAIEGIEWPFMIVFFVLAGASLNLQAVDRLAWLIAAYIGLRTLGTCIGTAAGAAAVKADANVRRWLGPALLPQAGVALGMALIASQQFPEHADLILPTVLTSTVVLELIAPIVTRRVLVHVGEGSAQTEVADSVDD